MPEYDLSDEKVRLTIVGKVLDINYARKLAQIPSMSLNTIILLDKVQKKKRLTKDETIDLRKQNFIEGRYPNIYISSQVALATGQKNNYIKNRRVQETHYKQMILDSLQYGTATRDEINDLLLDNLPKILDESQKKNKINNILYTMSKKDKTIVNTGSTRYPKWSLSLTNTPKIS